ncbi:MAG: hypothetical protein GY765_19090 [bacterium]|nr:hypothetical protein [bacterium]
MGAKVEEIFRVVEEKAGNNGRLKLAQLSKVSKNKAAKIRDDQEVVDYFKKLATQILGKDVGQFLNF